MRISDWSSDVCSSDLSLATSQAIKQDSDQIVDSIVAEDIGKLPDVTATESLARITGVQVDYANGTAAGTRVRGLPNIATTYNEIGRASCREECVRTGRSGWSPDH